MTDGFSGALAIAVSIGGLAVAGWGMVTALRVPRPGSLGAALIAALGLAVGLIGMAWLLIPGFFRR